MSYGTNSAAVIFQNVLQQDLSHISGVKNIADDIIIHGKSCQDHDKALDNCLKCLENLNLKAKGMQCSFLQKKIKFYGLIFSYDGTQLDPEHIDNLVKKIAAPTNASQVCSFLGMANTCHDYRPGYATITATLREVTKKNTHFVCNHIHQRAFDQLKKKVTESPVMTYFDTKKWSMVIVDASPVGISVLLAQREPNSQQYKIISYASRSLTPVERQYSQTDREALASVGDKALPPIFNRVSI